MACVVVLSLMRTLELEFLQPHPRRTLHQNELTSCNKLLGQLTQSLNKKLGCLMELFDENRMDDVEAIKDLETKLRDVAFQIEDEIELQVVHLYGEEDGEEEEEFEVMPLYMEMPQGNTSKKITHHSHSQRLYQILHPATGKSHPCLQFHRILHRAKQDIDAIQEELVKAKMEYNHFIALQGRNTTLDATPKFDDQLVNMDSSSKHASHSQDTMVGKTNEFETIREMLIQHPSKQLEVVSVQGMGGIGKTTLARRAYKDPSIVSHFDKRAWTVASQHYNKRQMLLGLLNLKNNANNKTDEDLALQLYQSFKCQRYMVVIDDIWSIEAWNDVKSCFPNDTNGSRVLFTTRLAEVANHTGSNNDFSHQMQLLEQSDSWNLFYEKACKSRGAEFETIGRPVVEKCKGLPLAIIVVVGLLSKLNTLDEWKKTSNDLSSSSETTLGDDECSRILSLSYNHLPHNLRACFLYLGVFPEDYEIIANHLARLWFAEGLVKESENESFDAVANRYIQELMDRNLIILSELSSCGRRIKRFRMHDLLQSFCTREAQKENLLHVVVSENSFDFPQKGFRWVRIHSLNFNMSTVDTHSKSCRSFFNFLWGDVSFDFKNFNLMRVLYTSTRFGRLKNIVDIVHLRFLWALYSEVNIELCSDGLFLKSRYRKNIQLSRAWNLQTLGCNSAAYRSDDGENYTDFPQLQYISCRRRYFHGSPPKFVREFYGSRTDYCSKEHIVNIPYLKKVRIDGKRRDCNDCITNLAYLEHLEGLHIFCDDVPTQTPINNHIVLLKNLRKLSFCNMGFEWKEINVLSKLPRLEVLKLYWDSCLDEEWEIPEEVIFGQLIFLTIYESDLRHWKASSKNFPKLECLQLCRCCELREIPIDFVDISTLKSIKLEYSLPSAVMSAKQIQEGQHDYGNENMIVIEDDTMEKYCWIRTPVWLAIRLIPKHLSEPFRLVNSSNVYNVEILQFTINIVSV